MFNDKVCFLIDDDFDDQELFELAVKKANPAIRCVFASDGDEAVKKLTREESFSPDFIFLDLNMPRMDGKTCLRAIRKISRLDNIPVIIYSTSNEVKDKLETKAMGANDYLEKPTNMTVLTNRLADIFNQ